MKLQRIRLEQVRQFRKPLEFRDLDDGINLFSGPNEAGKSTVVAAIRAAFLERHRSNGVEDLRPWGDGAAAPEIDIDFTLDGRSYALSKRFLQRKRCTLTIGATPAAPSGRTVSSETLDGATAEDRLSALLGFHYATRGASDAPQWGVPGLLWIQQGSGQLFRDAITHATDHLRGVLHDNLEALSSSGADGVTAKVEAARNALLTPATGAPRGAYAEAIARQQTLDAQHASLVEQGALYRQQVDALSALRRAHAAAEATQPWLAFRAQQREAERALSEIDALTQALEEARRQWRQCDAQIALLREQRDAFDAQREAVAARRTADATAQQHRQEAEAALAQWDERRRQAEAVLTQASADSERLQSRLRLAAWRQQFQAATAAMQKAERDVSQAEAALAQVGERRQLAETLAIDDRLVARLQKQRDALRDLRVRREVAATRIRYALHPGAVLQVGDTMLDGDGERLLLEETAVAIPGVGQLHIVPGGTDLAALGREEAALQREHDALLASHGLADLDAAQQRRDAARAAQADLQAAKAALAALAPHGVDALRDTFRAASGQLARLDASTPPGRDAAADAMEAFRDDEADDAALQSQAALQAAAVEDSRRRTEQATQQWHDARLRFAQARAAAEAAAHECAQAQTALDAPDRQARVAAVARALTDALAQAQTLQEGIARQEREIAQARPDILKQDIARFARSAQQHEQQHEERARSALRLEATLETAGAQGLDEQCADVAGALADASRRRDDLQRRATALDYLLGLLREKQKALTQRLQAPLQRHLQHYLSLLFPGAALTLDARMQPLTLVRDRRDGRDQGKARDEQADVDALSFGAREQLGILTRLAYADLLREAGKPTLLMLDDALVHSDETRLAQMKRALFDAGTRHQILLFTCHPERWQDLGVTPRPLA